QLIALDPVRIRKQSALRRSGSARAIRIIGAAVARAHEKTGLGEPADRAPEVSAVDGKDLKCLARYVANPTGNVGSLAVPGTNKRIAERCQARLAFRELPDRA